jgi:hypothetical protein
MFRSKRDRIVDDAHNRIACAEMQLSHSFTDEAQSAARDELIAAQRYLQRAVEAKQAWEATEHDDYEEYPDVPYDTQLEIPLGR